MEILDFERTPNPEQWLDQMAQCDWSAGTFLHSLLKENRFHELYGESARVLLLTDRENLVSFCTYAEKDEIRNTGLTPWIGFVYTSPAFRGRRLVGQLLEKAREIAREEGYAAAYISTGETGLYEKYGAVYMTCLPDENGKKSRIYRMDTGASPRPVTGCPVGDEHLTWEEISTEHIVRDEWIDFRKSVFRFPDGRIFQPYYSYTRKNYAVIVAFDEDGRLICVRQFRQGIRKVTTEFPAGAIEEKDGESAPEAALRAARRELREETGYVSDRWQLLMSIPSNATISDNYAWIFAAEGCRKEAQQDLDEMELLGISKHTPQELDALIAGGDFQQSMHVLAWLLARQRFLS